MVTMLLVCIFFGVNIRVYFDLSKIQCVISLILPMNINALNLRISFAGKRFFYKINNSKDRQIVLKKNKGKKNFFFKQIRLEKFNWTMSIGCNDNCLNGVYATAVVGYFLDAVNIFLHKYLSYNVYEKTIMPNFQKNNSISVLNIVIKKGILDIIKNLILISVKRGKYAN